jgi:hypothetical protein
MAYVITFLQSNALELAFFYIWHRQIGLTPARSLGLTTLANLITHPTIFFGHMAMGLTWLSAILSAELFAWWGEAALHASTTHTWRRWPAWILTSLLANLASWEFGPRLTWWLWLS